MTLKEGYLTAAVLAAMGAGCGDTGQARIAVPLYAEGGARALTRDDATFTLTRADIAFGPAYFCATASADPEHCEVALLELREVVLIDGLAARSDRLANMSGTTGEIRSALYDYGISWLLTRERPAASDAAPEGHSAVIEADVERAGQRLHFIAPLDLAPRARGDAAINAQRTRRALTDDEQALTLTVDPARWLARIDLDVLFALAGEEGTLTLSPGDQAYEAMLQGMQSSAPLGFRWDDVEAP